MKSRKKSETFFCVFLLIFLTFLFSPQSVAATNCVCAGGSPIPGYYPTIGAATTVSDDGACDQECANRSAKYYSYSNLGNIGFTRVTKTAISAPTANASRSATAGQFDYQPMEKIPGFETETNLQDFNTYVSVIYKFGIWAVGIAALLMITIGGFMYITSAGNNASMEKAKGVITDAIVGLLLALTSWIILYTINPALVTITPLAPTPITIAPTVLPTTRVGTGKCAPVGSGPCSPANLKATSCFNTDLLAHKASAICGVESGGNAAFPTGASVTPTDRCKDGRDYSFGLFQVNLIANGAMISGCEPNKIFNIYNASAGQLQGGCITWVTNSAGVKYCGVRDCEVRPTALALYNSCLNQLKNAQTNIQLACKLSGNGTSWSPWRITNSKCGF